MEDAWWFGLGDGVSKRATVLHHAYATIQALRFVRNARLLAGNATTGHGRRVARDLLVAVAGVQHRILAVWIPLLH